MGFQYNGRLRPKELLLRADGSVVMHRQWYGDTTWLTRPIAEAHRLGLKIMIKPHLAYWGSPFRWRGDITFETDDQWRRFFTQYEAWVTRAAEVCAEADAFVVGTELDRTLASLPRLLVTLDAKPNSVIFSREPPKDPEPAAGKP